MWSKKFLFLGQTILSIHRVSVSISVRLFYLHRLSQGKFLWVNIYVCCSLLQYVSNDVFFTVPTAVHPTGQGPCWCLRFRKVGQSFSDLTNLAIDVRKLLLKFKKHCTHARLFLLVCKLNATRHGPESPKIKNDEFASKMSTRALFL